MPRKKGSLEFRYYKVPHEEPVLALLGEKWYRSYGYDERNQPILNQHFHNLMEIGFCYEGKGEMVLEDTTLPYENGTVTIIPKNYPHTTNGVQNSSSRWEYLFIDVEETLRRLYSDRKREAELIAKRISKKAFCITATEDTGVAELVLRIFKEMRVRGDHYKDAVEGLLKILVVELFRLNDEPNVDGSYTLPKKTEQMQISAALEYLSEHYDKEIKIADLARICHMSETHFRRIFTHSMGVSPVDYINQFRIRMVCERLKKTNMPIADIALRCGFTSLATFNRNFRKIMGTTPNEWKKSPEAYESRLQEKRISVYDGW